MITRTIARRAWVAGAIVAGLTVWTCSARADLTLTPAGTTAGFGLSVFSFGYSNGGGVGPISTAYPSTGGVLASSYNDGTVRFFPTDTDGQNVTAFPAAPGATYGSFNPCGLAKIGSNIYMAEQAAGAIVQINNDGSFNQTIVTGVPFATGLVANPATNHLYVSEPNGGATYDVDPVAKTVTLFSNYSMDGLTISPDGHTLYGESGQHILGFDTSSVNPAALPIFDSGLISGLDGTALGTGTINGFIYANTNFGELWQVNLVTLEAVLIANGGSRGDLVSLDPNGTLLLSQTSTIDRLTAPQGGGFGGDTPEPASLGILGLGGMMLLLRRRRA